MQPPTPTPIGPGEDTPAPGSMRLDRILAKQAAASTASMPEFERQVAAFVTSLYPDASGVTIVIQVPDDEGDTKRVRLVVRLATAAALGADRPLSPTQIKVLAELDRYKAGEWVSSADLAKAAHKDPNSGYWSRQMAMLKELKRIESSTQGYRLRVRPD